MSQKLYAVRPTPSTVFPPKVEKPLVSLNAPQTKPLDKVWQAPTPGKAG